MLTCEIDSTPTCVRVASFPGGTANPYRVQVYNPVGAYWHLYANFAQRSQADACWRRLTLEGHRARIIECTRAPSAA